MTGSNQPASGRSRTAITYARVGDLGIALLGGGCFVSFGMVVVFYQTRVVRNKEPTTNQNHYLTGKAPYRFESAFLQQRVACEPDIFMRSRGSADHQRKRTQQSPEPWSGMTNRRGRTSFFCGSSRFSRTAKSVASFTRRRMNRLRGRRQGTDPSRSSNPGCAAIRACRPVSAIGACRASDSRG
jgi:hypothetical protein